MTRLDDGWVPLSAEPNPTRQRQRTTEVTRRVRAHAVRQAGGNPCHNCGGANPMSRSADPCRCSPDGTATALRDRCLRNAKGAS